MTSARSLRGATSSLVDAVEVQRKGASRSLVLRRFVSEEWVRNEPDVAIREAESVRHAFEANLPAPELVACDGDGSRAGVPATLVTMLTGDVVLDPTIWKKWLDGLAVAAAQIHRVDAAGFPWKYRRYNEREALTVPLWSQRPEVWKKAIEIVEGPAPAFREAFVHRDFHPSNILWQNGAVTGIVDWVNGCKGPPGIDVAWCRHNLANLHGVSIADDFLSAYLAAAGSGFQYEPYWDLMSVVELLPGPPSMYEGWRAAGFPQISDTLMRERVDLYVTSVVARL